MASLETELRSVPFRQWAKENNIETGCIKVLERNGVKTLEDVIRVKPGDLKGLGLNFTERRRLEAALKPWWGGAPGPQDLPADLRKQLAGKLQETKIKLGLDSLLIEDPEVDYEEEVDDTDVIEVKPETPVDDLQQALSRLQIVNQGPPITYKLPVQETSRCPKFSVRRCECGEKTHIAPEKSIMMIGETGTGKSTMINALVNYLMGVDFNRDNFRFDIIDQASNEPARKGVDSQTDWITTYTIHHSKGFRLPCTLNIVDTPGYGDTRGPERDRRVTEQIRELFQSKEQYGLDILDAICFVMKASSNRLTLSQKYIVDSVFTIFGKNVEDNIFVMMTFADDAENPVLLSALKEQNVPFTDFYATNNLWLQTTTTNLLGKYYWELAETAFSDFFKYLQTSHPKSLMMSVEVIEERRELEECVEGLIRLISSTTGNIANRSPKAVVKYELMKVATRENNLNCVKCQSSCKLNCGMFARLAMKFQSKGAPCQVCRCLTKNHEMKKWTYQWTKSQKLQKQRSDVDTLQKDSARELQAQVERLKVKMSRLHEIALRPQLNNTGQYLDIVIAKEKHEKYPGYQDRITVMNNLRKKYALIDKLGSQDLDYRELLG